MKLKRFVDTLVYHVPKEEDDTPSPQAAYSTRSYGAERAYMDKTPVVLTASFEIPWTHRRTLSSPTAVVHRKGGHAKEVRAVTTCRNTTSATPTILASNPISQFLQSNKVGCSGGGRGRDHKLKTAETNTKVFASPRKGKPKPITIPTVTQNLWSLRAVAPLIQWLQHHRVRYSYADWECQHTNGARTRTVSQHGIVMEDRETATQAEYMCEASFGKNLYVRMCRTAYVPGSVSTYDWWSDVKAGAVTPLPGGGTKHVPMAFSVRPSGDGERESGKVNACQTDRIVEEDDRVDDNAQGPVSAKTVSAVDTTSGVPHGLDPLETSVLSYAAAGVYSQVRQHRVYRWDRVTSVHLSTTDGKGYRVWLEHCVEEVGLQKEFRKLLAVLAYHLSFHT